jgi:hypothetical protein
MYLDRTEFEAQQDNAFMVFRETDVWSMDARWQGQTHRIELQQELIYRGPLFSARLDPETFELWYVETSADARDGDEFSLEACAAMYVLLTGLRESVPHLPTALPVELATIGKIPHPGYAE